MADETIVASLTVAAAAGDSSSSFDADEAIANSSIAESMVTYLRTEANQAEERAKRLRKQAAEIAQQFGITEESQLSYGTYRPHSCCMILNKIEREF